MAGTQEGRGKQAAAGGRDANIAGRDQVVVSVGAAGLGEPAVPGLLPRDVPGFTGREGELQRLTGLAGGGSVVVTAIGGTAGVGKTALAVHAAHRLLPQFPDGHLYADLRGYTEGQDPADPGEVLEVFLRRLGVPGADVPAAVEERSGLLRQLLAPGQVLMLLDNARTEVQVRPLLPGAGGSLVLITSRSVLAGLEVDERIGLDVLPETEADALLAALIGPERATAEPRAVRQVRDWCGCLPLALRIAGQLLAAYPTWPIAKLAGILADERHRLDQLMAGDQQVRAAFMVSYRQLADADARMFRLLGLHPGSDIDATAAARLAGIGPGEAEPVLDRLAQAYLITEDASSRFAMHDLLRLFARQMCQNTDDQETRDAALARLFSHYAELARFLDACLDPVLRPAEEQAARRAGQSLPAPRQALALVEAERLNLLAVLALAAKRGWHEKVWKLSEYMHDTLELLHHLDDMLTVSEAALAAARGDGNTAAESRALNNLGIAYEELRRFEEAIGCYQEALAIYRETGDRRGEGQTLNNLGIVYEQLRRFEEAIGCYEQDLAICRETGDRRGEGQTLNNLGSAYEQLRRFEEAIGCHQEALAIFRETGDRRGEGMAVDALGIAYRELRRFEEAIGCHQEALAIDRETGDRHSEGQTLNNLGSAYEQLRRFEEAIGCHQEALAIFRETGDRHSEGQTLNNLGIAYRELRRFEEAIGCHQEALAIDRETGDRHSEGQTLNNLGIAYRELRRFEEAIGCHQEALAIDRETGDRHSEGQTLNNLGSAYQGLRRPDQAAGCWRDAAAAMRDVGDDEQAVRLEQRAADALSRRRRWRPTRLSQ